MRQIGITCQQPVLAAERWHHRSVERGPAPPKDAGIARRRGRQDAEISE
jgi:hypothetical protein